MQLFNNQHLSYCTNVHPAETWQETFLALCQHTIPIKNELIKKKSRKKIERGLGFGIGLRLSARAAEELLEGDNLKRFQSWLKKESCYVFTINGFPYGDFHAETIKEQVYRPDWTSTERLDYTNNLFTILATLCPKESGGSVSTSPGSFKAFNADEETMFQHLYTCAKHIEKLAVQHGKDLHLGLEPEPLGHFENTEETLAFFKRFFLWLKKEQQDVSDISFVQQRIGVNYDTCHFALEFDPCIASLEAFHRENIRISKIHLSNALELNPSDPEAWAAIRAFDESSYLHQVIIDEPEKKLRYFKDLPDFLATNPTDYAATAKARVHFHIPLYAKPDPPLASTQQHAKEALSYLWANPETCPHLEMETYTWNVLPKKFQQSLHKQLVEEYLWTLDHF